MNNRHERRKAEATEVTETTMTTAEFQALDSICIWEGCMEVTHVPLKKLYLPEGWTALILFWAPEVPKNIMRDVPPENMFRDAVLCPQHTAMLQLQLKSRGKEVRGIQ